MSATYHNLGPSAEPYQWQEKYSSGGNRRKWIIVGSVVGLIALIAIGVGVGVSVSHNNKNSSNHAASPTSTSGGPVVNQTDPNDPSTFIKDSRLHEVFYGMDYTPNGSQLPNCGNSLSDVIQDIQLISQLTTRIRLYGADCNQSALVLEAIKQTKTNLSVYLANYNVPNDAGAAYTRQRDLIISALKTYGSSNVLGVIVGNEYMLNWLDSNSATDPNSAIGNTGAQLLITNITDTRNAIAALNLPNKVQVGNSEAGSYYNTLVLQAIDFGMANVHPWFGNVSIQDAAGWTWEFFEEQDVQPAAAVSNKPQMYIAETGWPSSSLDAASASDGPSTASIANLQTFLDTFVCQSNKNGTGYFFFEFQDQAWQAAQFGGVEGSWGLFTSNKTLKALTMPTC